MALRIVGYDSSGHPLGGYYDANSYPVRRCFVLGGVSPLIGSPRASAGIGAGVSTVNIGSAGTLTGVLMAGDKFTFASEGGEKVVTGGPYRAVGNAITGVQFTPGTSFAVPLNTVIAITGLNRLMERVAPEAGGAIDGVTMATSASGGYCAAAGFPVQVEASAAFAEGADLETLVDGRVKAIAGGKAVLRSLEVSAGAGSIVWAVFKSGV